MRIRSSFSALVLAAMVAGPAHAASILHDWGLHVDGDVTLAGDDGSSVDTTLLPGTIDISGFNGDAQIVGGSDDGLGSVTVTIEGAATHYVSMFVDHEIDEAANTFFNEHGIVVGTPSLGQTWEIDEPSFSDILFDNFGNGTLDGTNTVPVGAEDDVSMALAWSFNLLVDQIATITFTVASLTDPDPGGFQLQHFDPDSNEGLRFFSTLSILDPMVPQVSEPATLALLLAGLSGLLLRRRRIG